MTKKKNPFKKLEVAREFDKNSVQTLIKETFGKKNININTNKLIDDLNSAGRRYWMNARADIISTSKQRFDAIKSVNKALDRLLLTLCIDRNFSPKKQQFLMVNNGVYHDFESCVEKLGIRDNNDPHGNYILSTYRRISELKKISVKALTLSKKELKAKKALKPHASADAIMMGKILPEIYEKHFKSDFGTSCNGGDKYGPAIRFIQKTYHFMFRKAITGNTIDSAYRAYNKKFPRIKVRTERIFDEFFKKGNRQTG